MADIVLDDNQGQDVASLRTLGTGPLQAAAGDDARLSDARAPLTHGHAQANVTGLVTDLALRELAAMRTRVPFTEIERQRMIALYEGGLSLNKTAATLGRSMYGVYYALMKTGERSASLATRPARPTGPRSSHLRLAP